MERLTKREKMMITFTVPEGNGKKVLADEC